MTASRRTKDGPPSCVHEDSSRSQVRFLKPAPIDIKHSALETVRDGTGTRYECMCMCEDVSDRAWYNARYTEDRKGGTGNLKEMKK